MKKVCCVLVLVFLGGAVGKAGTLCYLRFEEGSGFGAYDEEGRMNGGVMDFTSVPGGGYTGRGWSTDVPSATVPLTGQANTGSMHFTDFIDLSTINTLILGYEFTIELFMKPEMPVSVSPMFNFSYGSALSFWLGEDSGNLYFGSLLHTASTSDSASLVSLNEWQHFALVVDSTSYAIYINSQVQASNPLPTGGEGPYQFGTLPVAGTRSLGDGFSGWMDEFRISDEALSPSQFLNATIPEPTTLGLLGLGLLSLLIRRRK
ncbi:MAG: LamG domain-containing protein [Verrucomicrobiota bacterium]|jgi:hypothetical protein|nr:LamG domain-containing protein [Verrucomicrobiota bacterium]